MGSGIYTNQDSVTKTKAPRVAHRGAFFSQVGSGLSTQYSVLKVRYFRLSSHHDNLVVDLLHTLNRSNRSIELGFERFASDRTRQRYLAIQNCGGHA